MRRVFRRATSGDHEGQRPSHRARARWLVAIGVLGFGGAITALATAATPPPATASMTPALRYIGDSTGSVYTFTVKNTGMSAIGAVQITRPPTWVASGCPTPPAGWTATVSSSRCRFVSTSSTSDDIKPGQSKVFNVKAKTDPGTTNRTGRWGVVVSKTNSFSNTANLKTAASTGSGLTSTLYTWEVTDAVVADIAALRGTACPATNRSALLGSTKVLVICGRNHANTTLTPTAARSTLSGSYVTSKGVFRTGAIARDSANVVLGHWTAVKVPSTYGFSYKVITGVGSASTQTSPVRTFAGYIADSHPPVTVDDAHSTSEDTPLTVPAPGVLVNDSDQDAGDPQTAIKKTEPSNGTATLNGDGSFTYTPNANFHGSDSFTYIVNDSHVDSAPATVTITVLPVNDAPVAQDDATTTTEDASVQLPLFANDSDVDGDTLVPGSITTTSPGGSFNVALDGTATFDPDGDFESLKAGEPQVVTYTYTVSDGHGGTDTADAVITITGVNDAPVAVADTFQVTEDTPFTATAPGVKVNDTDDEGDALTATLVAGPANAAVGGFTLNADGSFDYTPAVDFAGDDSFTYKVNDGTVDSGTVTVDLEVQSVNDAPTAGSFPVAVDEDTPKGITLTGSDVDGDPITFDIVTGPAHGSLGMVVGDQVTYTPDAGYHGDDSFTYESNDGTLDSAAATVTITVASVNDLPEADDDMASTDEDTPLLVTAPGVLVNDSDADGDPLTAVLVTDPAHGTLTLNADGSYSYTPAANYNGPDSFTYRADDGTDGSNVATVTIDVDPVNDAPTANAGTVSTPEDTAKEITLTGSDVENQSLTYDIVTGPAHGSLGAPSGDKVTYTPDANYFGPDSFTFSVNDGTAGSAPATVTIDVTSVNDLPSAENDTTSTDEDTAKVVSVLANDSDVEGALTLTSVHDAVNGTVVNNGDGTATFTPAANYTGPASFEYTVTDGDGATDSATVTVTVGAVNDAPVATGDPAATTEAAAKTIDVLANDSDADGDTLTVSGIDTTGTSGTVTNNGTDVTYDPNGMFEYLDDTETATDTFTYTVSDGHGGTDVETVTVTISGLNDAPVANDDGPFQTFTNSNIMLTTPGVLANDTDADGEALTAGNASDPAHGSVTLEPDGSFSYTPDAGYNGTDTFTYDVTDGTATDTATVAITVVPPNATPTADATSASGDEDGGAMTVTLTGHDPDGDPLTFTAFTATNGLVTVPTGISCDAVAPSTCTATVTYTPNADFHGSDSFTYTVNDGTIDSAPATASITVSPVNDVPSFTKGDNQTVAEDAGAQTVSGWATAISAGPANESDQVVSFVVTNDDAGLFAVAPAVDGAGQLTYTPAVNANGVANVTVKAMDDGGGTDTSAGQVFTITVSAVNDAPSFTKGADQTVLEDSGAYSVSNWATAISKGPGDESAQTLSFTTSNDNNALFSVQPGVSPTGTLTYTPALNAVGSATVTITLSDNGGGSDTSPAQTFTITVSPVNDAPTFTTAGNQTVLEDAGAQTVNAFVTSSSAGPADESAQTVTTAVTGHTNAALFSVAPSISNGVLTYTPAADANGSSTVTVQATDDGGTANGGVATSTPQTFTIAVTPVNDAPSFTKGADQTVDEDAGAHSVSNWASPISKGPADESAQTVSFTVTNGNNSLFSTQPLVTPSGTLQYTSAPNQYGSATVSVSIKDNGGTDNGGDDTSDTQTFTITVNPVNDAPVAAAKNFTVQANMKISLSGLLVGATDPNDSPVPAGQPAYTPSYTVGSITVDPAAGACTGCANADITNVNTANGTFDFDPPAGGTGTFKLRYTVVDSGYPTPGATSATQTITITVNGPVIWFVDPTAGAGGTGRLSAPYSTLGAATTEMGSTVNERIFVKGGNVTGNVTLPTDGWLISEAATGANFDDVMGITPPAGTIARPAVNGTQRTLTGTVTLGQNSVVRGFDVTASGGGNGLVGSGKTGLVVNQLSVTSTTGRAVDLASSSGVFNLRRVSSNGASRGISLVNTNVTTGSFTVTGTGTTAGSGGTITNSTGTGGTTFGGGEGGIHLNNTKNVSLDRMNVTSNQGSGIYGTDVTGFTLANSTVTGNGSDHGKDHDGIHFDTVLGTVSITNTTVSGSRENNIRFRNNSGTSNITVTGSTLSSPHTSFGANNLILDTYNNAVATLAASGNTISSSKTAGIAVYSNSSGSTNATIGTNTLTGNQQGVDLGGNGTGASTFVVDGVTATGCSTCGAQLHAYKGTQATGSPMVVTFRNNSVNGLGSQLAAGIWVHGEGPGALRSTITNNTVRGIQHFGINGAIGNSGNASMDLNISNNDVDLSAAGGNATYAIYVENGTVPGDANATCANIKTNRAITVAGIEGIAVSNWNSTGPFRLPGFGGGNDAAAESFIVSGNTAPVTADATSPSGSGFTGGAACNTP